MLHESLNTAEIERPVARSKVGSRSNGTMFEPLSKGIGVDQSRWVPRAHATTSASNIGGIGVSGSPGLANVCRPTLALTSPDPLRL